MEYLAEPIYFHDPGFPVRAAALTTAKCCLRWARSYEAWPVGDTSGMRTGAVPANRSAAEALIDELFAWAERASKHPALTGLRLRAGDRIVLDQHDGIPATLVLSEDQFAVVRSCLGQAGLPEDLYFRADARRFESGPTERFGGVVRGTRVYSPLEWRRRADGRPSAAEIPSEEERQARFLGACRSFRTAANLRLAELSEPGKTPDPALFRMVEDLVDGMLVVELVTQGRDVKELRAALARARARETAPGDG